ncbi:MAG: SPOR domain-containing protein [Aquabacterium sp.]
MTRARTQARRRLIGATVLLGVAVIAFPLLLETQPRPIALDIPIEIPRKDSPLPLGTPVPAPANPTQGAAPALSGAGAAAAVAAPVEASGAGVSAAPAPASQALQAAKPATGRASEVVERAGQQGREVPAPASAPKLPDGRVAAAASAPTPADAERARALLEGRDAASAAPSGRFVVQVGAFTDEAALREARQKVERLGLKSYTQVVVVEGVRRTRVRVGPFAGRDEADRTAAKVKATGMAAHVLTLAP